MRYKSYNIPRLKFGTLVSEQWKKLTSDEITELQRRYQINRDQKLKINFISPIKIHKSDRCILYVLCIAIIIIFVFLFPLPFTRKFFILPLIEINFFLLYSK